jgi:hypothetical protein
MFSIACLGGVESFSCHVGLIFTNGVPFKGIMPTPKRVREESDGAVLGNSPNSRLSKRQIECRDEERKVVHASRNRRLISYHDNETSSSSSEADSDCEKVAIVFMSV